MTKTNELASRESEQNELHRTIWKVAEELRGAVDGWDFKQYVLGIMFYRYISLNITNYINDNQREAGDIGFDYVTCSDEEAKLGRNDIIQEKGFFILPSELFNNVIKACDHGKNIQELNLTLR